MILPELSPGIREAYAKGATHHDGGGHALVVDRGEIMDGIGRLLIIGRMPKIV
jgi:hypothetical protein